MRASLEERGFRVLIGIFNAAVISIVMVSAGIYIFRWLWRHG